MLGEYRSGGRPRGTICLKRFKCSGPPVELGGLWADVPRPQNHGADV